MHDPLPGHNRPERSHALPETGSRQSYEPPRLNLLGVRATRSGNYPGSPEGALNPWGCITGGCVMYYYNS